MKRPGRPALDTAGTSADVHLTLPSRQYDEAWRLAKEKRESVQDVIRRGLKRLIEDERGGRF